MEKLTKLLPIFLKFSIGILLVKIAYVKGQSFFINRNLKVKNKELKRPIWKQLSNKYSNEFILYQYDRGDLVPSYCPIALSIETYLRMCDIKYINSFKNELGLSYNQFYCEPNFDLIVEFIKKNTGKYFDQDLGELQKSVSRAYKKLVEESLKWPLAIHRFIYEKNKHPIGLITPENISDSVEYQNYKQLFKDRVYELARLDLKALSDFIGDKGYLLGDDPCSADAVIFSFITLILNNDKGPLREMIISNFCNPFKKTLFKNNTLTDDYPNLIKYHEKIKANYWKDWYYCINDQSKQQIYFYLS